MQPSDFKYRAISHLYLNYYYAWITIGKVALVTVARTRLKQTECETPDVSETVKTLANWCTKAARKTLLLFENLTRNQKITRFSFTDFQGCSIATIVTLVSGVLERDSGYDTRVEFGLGCLRRMATGNMTAKLGVRFVEAVRSITNEAASKLQRNAFSGEALNLAVHSDYDQWVDWLTVQENSQRHEYVLPPQEGTPPIRENRDQDSDPWLVGQSTPRAASTWQTQVEQDTPATPSNPHNYLDGPLQPLRPLEYDFLSTLDNDEQSFLMGLTGLDVLDFSGLTIQLEH